MKTLHVLLLASVISAIVSAATTALFLPRTQPAALSSAAGMDSQGTLPSERSAAGNSGGASAISARRAFASTDLDAARDGARAGQTPQMQRLDSELRFKQIYQSFKAEPVAPAWARETESMVRDAFSSDEAVAMGGQAPLQAKIECRSSRCRIETVYPSEGAAVDAAQMLQMDIGGKLPRTQVMSFAQPDGSTRLVIYADSRPLPTANRSPSRG
jgi:hypothetical protein